MRKMKDMSEGSFLKLVFGTIAFAFLVAAVCMPDRGSMFTGLWNIISQPAKVATNYFALGGYAATFLNMSLVTLICLLLFVVFRGTPNNVSTLAVILTAGFCTWGINVLNMWFSIAGVVIYGLVKREKMGSLVNAMLFSTGIAPIISDMLLRYPHEAVVGFHPAGVLLALAVGIFIGFILPAGMAYSPNVHKGFDMYSAALPVGMTAFFLQAFLYKTMGVALPSVEGGEASSALIVNVFCLVLFGFFVVMALLMGCKPRDYWKLLASPDQVGNVTSTCGNAVFMMNMGVYGLFILAYYNLIGANFNGVVFGIILCMLSCCNSGATPATVWPIMLGYVAAAFGCQWLSSLTGGTFGGAINAQPIAIGLCFASGLAPITKKYGWYWTCLAAIVHYVLVTTVPLLHGGFCLYNGGFTAALTCLLLVPQMERFSKTREEKRALAAKK